MFTQFFGNFLLNEKLVEPSHLAEGMELKNQTRLKLGVLAINAGYMNAKQVDEVHTAQSRIDKRFGDIAVDMGYLTNEQVDSLLSSQKTGYLLLGQALVDKGYLTNEQFENAINEYKEKYRIIDDKNSDGNNELINLIITEFYHFDTVKNAKFLTSYVTLLYKNIVRFIGDDFAPLEATVINNFECKSLISQNITGAFSAFTAIEASPEAFAKVASRYAQEDIGESDEYITATVGEFLNLHNGLFTVNMSNEKDLELDLTPQSSNHNTVLSLLGSTYCIPMVFPFGTVNFIISNIDDQNN